MTYETDPATRVGHVHFKVSDLERSVAFYRDVLGFQVTQRFGHQAAFLAAGGYHHHIGLNTWHSQRGGRPAKGTTGLYHGAFLYPTRAALGRAIANVRAHDVDIYGASDHGVSLAVYFDDPDGNGIELYWDRPTDDWPRDADGHLQMISAPFDLDALVAEGAET